MGAVYALNCGDRGGREWDGYSAAAAIDHDNNDLINQQLTNIRGRRRRGACNDDDDNNDNHNNHNDLIGNETSTTCPTHQPNTTISHT